MRGGWLLIVVVLVAALAGAGPALAADAAKAGAKDDSPFGGEMHQILDLAIWTVVVFLVLLFVLSRFAWKPMLAGLKQREDSIRGALDEAAKARDEAKAMRAQLQEEMGRAHAQVKGIIEEAKRDAQVTADELLTKAKADIQTERDRLRREIEMETDQALQSLWSRAAELATQVSAKALRRELDGDGHKRLIDEALVELRESGPRSGNGHA